MKRKITFLFVLSFLIFVTNSVFAKELDGPNFDVVSFALNAKLETEFFEEYAQKVECINRCEKQLNEMLITGDISDEAKLISRSIILLQKENMRTTEELRLAREQSEKKKRKDDEKNPEAEKLVMGCYSEYTNFLNTHKDLSSHFFFHYKEVEFATLPYISKSQQLKMFTGILDDYKKIDQMNPNLSENLVSLGMSLYFLPGVAGGSKKDGKEKVQKAVKTAACTFEKVNALGALSQILFEEKDFNGAEALLNQAFELAPGSTTLKELKEMNAAGYSMMEGEKYRKSKNK